MTKTRAKRVILALTILGALGVATFLWVPHLIRHSINEGLAVMPSGYRGHVEDVGLRFTGLDLVGLKIEKRDGSVKLPYMRMKMLRVTLVEGDGRWPELELRFVKPQVNFVDGPTPAAQQWGPDINLAELKQKLKLELRRVVVDDGEVHLRHFKADPPVDVYVDNLQVWFDRVTDCLPPSTTCNATLDVRARAMAQAPVRARGTLVHDETGRLARDEKWRFDVRARVDELRLPKVNAALIEYAKLDIQKGSASVLATLHLHDERLFGNVRPVLRDVDVVGKRDEDSKLGRELLAGMAAHFVEKRKGRVVLHYDKAGKGKLRTRIEVEDEAPPAVEQHAQREP